MYSSEDSSDDSIDELLKLKDIKRNDSSDKTSGKKQSSQSVTATPRVDLSSDEELLVPQSTDSDNGDSSSAEIHCRAVLSFSLSRSDSDGGTYQGSVIRDTVSPPSPGSFVKNTCSTPLTRDINKSTVSKVITCGAAAGGETDSNQKSDHNNDSSEDDDAAFERFLSDMKRSSKSNRCISDDDDDPVIAEGNSHNDDSDYSDTSSMGDFIVSDDASLSYENSSTDGEEDSVFYIKTTNLLKTKGSERDNSNTTAADPLLRYSGVSLSSTTDVNSEYDASFIDDRSKLSEHSDLSQSQSSCLRSPSFSESPANLSMHPIHQSKRISSQHSSLSESKSSSEKLSLQSRRSFGQQVSFSSQDESSIQSEHLDNHGKRTVNSPPALDLSDDDDLFDDSDTAAPSSGQLKSPVIFISSDEDDQLLNNVLARKQTPAAGSKEGKGLSSRVKTKTKKLSLTTPSTKLKVLEESHQDNVDTSLPSLSDDGSHQDVFFVPKEIETPAPTRIHATNVWKTHTVGKTSRINERTPDRVQRTGLLDTIHCNLTRTEPRPFKSKWSQATFLASLSTILPAGQTRNTEAERYVRQFKKYREDLIQKLFQLYNTTVFEGKLTDVPVKNNKRLLKTAGLCSYTITKHNKIRSAAIELSDKVCDSAERVRDTLIHEMCHAAVWIINEQKDGHGRYWQYWARKSELTHRDLPPIRRCHSYDITTKYIYKCSNCGQQIGRHSKSLDLSKKVCGVCKGRFILLTQSASGVQTPARTPNKFAMFVKENFASVKKNKNLGSHKAVMEELASQFAKLKS